MKTFSLPMVVLFVLALAAVYAWVNAGRNRLIIYCAHDALYSEAILERFSEATGIKVTARFDNEATKSLGLVELLIREKDHARCDVFWNNELLGMMDLQARGVLEPYKGSGYARIPGGFKDPAGHWTGFAARLRVFIVNTNHLEAGETAIQAALAGDLSRVAMAKPMFGTTLTHYSVLWKTQGAEQVKAWHADLRQRGLQEVPGNGPVKNLVARGLCDLGYTDSDDYSLAFADGKPVAVLPVRLDNGQTICIPNTVALIKGTRHRAQAEQLVDFLLSAECETLLANARSRQIPLGEVDETRIPEEVRRFKSWAADGIGLTKVLDARNACLDWLKE
jgi:iron(III) transport system substrate-binding protein